MNEILKQLATPAIITGLISSLYAYFQKRKEEYHKYVYENKQENFKELVVYVDELVDKGITNPDLEKLLFKISQKINPYGREIKTFGKYQWIEDDGYVWYQIEMIEKKLASKILQIEDLKELAHRIQISKRLLNIKVEQNISPINSVKIWFYLFQYGMLLLQMFLIYFGYNSFIEQPTELSLLLAYWLIVVVILIFLLPELSVNESDHRKSEIGITVLIFSIVAVDAITAYYSFKSYNNVFIAPLVGIVSLCLIVGVLILKAIIFGASEIGKVSTIYIEEYRKLQEPKLSKRRFIDNFTVIPFFNKIQKLFHKDKREGNDDP
ncbi:conserved domain protein [Streptococcus mitis SK1080]|uniref:Conserved domain protein n=1 Tax=Streptococcus mitis SK1080 TaxID=1008453 RepID=F9HNS8_STRMT|nr:conserved domain protein [Streptococcus mitis SK1080]